MVAVNRGWRVRGPRAVGLRSVYDGHGYSWPSTGNSARVKIRSVREARGKATEWKMQPFVRHTILPITVAGLTRAIRVAIMPQLDADCYLGANFARAFWAVLDPDTNRLFCKEAEAYIKLEVASLTIDTIAVSATGANAASDLQRERLKAKAEQRSPAGLRARRVVERPWHVVAGDIIKPLPRTSKGFEYILVLQDLCTRWVEASPIRKVKAKTVVRELNRKIFVRFGCPEVLV